MAVNECRPWRGLGCVWRRRFQGLTPLANHGGPSGAEEPTLRSRIQGRKPLVGVLRSVFRLEPDRLTYWLRQRVRSRVA
jgi:hypothetical protein